MSQSTTSVADTGYTHAMRLMAAGKLNTVELWRPEAFGRYREAVVYGAPDREWMECFNRDLQHEIGTRFSASFLSPDDEFYPKLAAEDGPVAVIELKRDAGTEDTITALIVVRPEADQVLTPVETIGFIM